VVEPGISILFSKRTFSISFSNSPTPGILTWLSVNYGEHTGKYIHCLDKNSFLSKTDTRKFMYRICYHLLSCSPSPYTYTHPEHVALVPESSFLIC
jgi:hypothetical protein